MILKSFYFYYTLLKKPSLRYFNSSFMIRGMLLESFSSSSNRTLSTVNCPMPLVTLLQLISEFGDLLARTTDSPN